MDLERIASDFWKDTGYSQTFPKPIEQALALKLPVTIVKLPEVTVRAVRGWLRKKKHCKVFPHYDCELMGCLYAHKDQGFIFVCGADPPDEQRFTIAHDTAHFIVDYWLPRNSVIAALGERIKAVLDGERPATTRERATAVLSGVRVGPHWHLLPRFGREIDDERHVAHAEDRADSLGLELVAPKRSIHQLIKHHEADAGANVEAICQLLADFFGLPGYVFEDVVSSLVRRRSPTFLEEVIRTLRR